MASGPVSQAAITIPLIHQKVKTDLITLDIKYIFVEGGEDYAEWKFAKQIRSLILVRYHVLTM